MKSTLIKIPVPSEPLTFPCLLQWEENQSREVVLAINEHEGVVIFSEGSSTQPVGHFYKRAASYSVKDSWEAVSVTWKRVPYPIAVRFTP